MKAEARRWSCRSSDELLSELHDVQAYEVERDSKKYQVEVELLEDTDTYVEVRRIRSTRRDWSNTSVLLAECPKK